MVVYNYIYIYYNYIELIYNYIKFMEFINQLVTGVPTVWRISQKSAISGGQSTSALETRVASQVPTLGHLGGGSFNTL
jgi:hypothetical protein